MLKALEIVLIAMASVTLAQPTTTDAPSKASEMLTNMTLEEKIGQMTQINLELFYDRETLALDEEKLAYYAGRGVGSYLQSPYAGGQSPVDNSTGWNATQWRGVMNQIQTATLNASRLDIPMIFGIDNVHGGTYVQGSTLFGQQICASATFNLDLVEKMGEVTGKDTAGAGMPWTFGPISDIATDPRWPRFYETFGEDPFLNKQMAVAITKGIQANGDVAACLKHFLGYGAADNGKDYANANINDYELLNYHAEPFRAAVRDAQAKSAMIGFNSINGVPVTASHKMTVDLLRGDMGFDGMLVTDYNEVYNLKDRHRISSSNEQSVEIATNQTSMDLNMVPNSDDFIDILIQLVNDGKISQERIDESVERILELKFDLGLFDTPVPGEDLVDTVGQQADQDLALELARESIVLVKNNNSMLPIPKEATVLVTGPSADNMGYMCGGWTTSWQGYQNNIPYAGFDTILSAMQGGNGTVVQGHTGVNIDGSKADDYDASIEAAKSSDYTVVVAGEHSYTEKPGDINDLSLAAGQQEYIKALAATGTKVILVLVEGRPRLLDGAADNVDAVLVAMLPCTSGGVAISEIIYGDVNPSGKLPFSYPKYSGNVPLVYYHLPSEICTSETNIYEIVECEMEWKFGHGMGYSTFEYSDLVVGDVEDGGNVSVSVTVTNTGDRAGKETVLLFLSQEYRQYAEPEVKMLKAFEKIDLDAGANQTVEFVLDSSAYSYYVPQIGEGYNSVSDAGATMKVLIGADTECDNDSVNPNQTNDSAFQERRRRRRQEDEPEVNPMCGAFEI
ncbi:hypothetical protein SARC_11582 [Sphaeroforma arctica JP610]|uniref:beta-glucosidase n=1 Tax=Sphaeroforma arctica JP610 TaxID=667725 RepID=A0A0L0FHF1_9EUKA|nr:hypothetical protein SARC_11582 [Sphaeroforma arctica JP610]KNC75901.1 hypothetical protein SARC_11582 [Sphaeroforma arctica JP610]|eukprot:XP_014149803.1 hypothetical protein SARC_11582 [Sphaeroforma arctica JP610]